jgi:hypothetical protein
MVAITCGAAERLPSVLRGAASLTAAGGAGAEVGGAALFSGATVRIREALEEGASRPAAMEAPVLEEAIGALRPSTRFLSAWERRPTGDARPVLDAEAFRAGASEAADLVGWRRTAEVMGGRQDGGDLHALRHAPLSGGTVRALVAFLAQGAGVRAGLARGTARFLGGIVTAGLAARDTGRGATGKRSDRRQ